MRIIFVGRNEATQTGFVNSNCYSNLTTIRKMISTIESEKDERVAKKKKSFDTSAKGLDAWGKEFGLLGWASGTLNCCGVCNQDEKKYSFRQVHEVSEVA